MDFVVNTWHVNFLGFTQKILKVAIFDGARVKHNLPHTWTRLNLMFGLQAVNFFLGNGKVENYTELLENMLSSCNVLSSNRSIKVNYLHNCIDRVPENLGDFSKELRYSGTVAYEYICTDHLVHNSLSYFSLI